MRDGEPEVFSPAGEFDCRECGRHIVVLTGPVTGDRCATCLATPGWFNDPDLVRVLDPDWDAAPTKIQGFSSTKVGL